VFHSTRLDKHCYSGTPMLRLIDQHIRNLAQGNGWQPVRISVSLLQILFLALIDIPLPPLVCRKDLFGIRYQTIFKNKL
jgi:hypothetical protein